MISKQNAGAFKRQPHVQKFSPQSLGNGWTPKKSKGLHKHYRNLSTLKQNNKKKLTRFVELHGARFFSERVNSEGKTRKQLLSNNQMTTETKKLLNNHAKHIGINANTLKQSLSAGRGNLLQYLQQSPKHNPIQNTNQSISTQSLKNKIIKSIQNETKPQNLSHVNNNHFKRMVAMYGYNNAVSILSESIEKQNYLKQESNGNPKEI